MTTTNKAPRVLLAVTEASPVDKLWRAALDFLQRTEGDLTILLVRDDRWHRAASLPFTREISRLGAGRSDFTIQRAEEVSSESLARLRALTQTLASEARLRCSFEELKDTDLTTVKNIVSGRQSILIADSPLTSLPIYASLTRLDCQVVLVDADEDR